MAGRPRRRSRLRGRGLRGRRHPRPAVRIPPTERAAVSHRVEELVSAGYSPRYAARRAYQGRDPEPHVRYLPKTGVHAVMHGDQAVSVHRSRRDADREVAGAREARELAHEARGAVRYGRRRRAARDCVGIHTHADLSELAQQAQEAEHDPARPRLHHYRVFYQGRDGREHSYDVRSSSYDRAANAAYGHHGHGRFRVEPIHRVRRRGERDPARSGRQHFRVIYRGLDGHERHYDTTAASLDDARDNALLRHRNVRVERLHSTKLPRGYRRRVEEERDPAPRRRGRLDRQHHLTAAQRRAIPLSKYALPAREALPIEDPAHIRNAAARLEQMRRRGTVTPREYASALRAIRAAEARHGIGPYRRRGR
jgi:hypothetical protein